MKDQVLKIGTMCLQLWKTAQVHNAQQRERTNETKPIHALYLNKIYFWSINNYAYFISDNSKRETGNFTQIFWNF